MYDAKDIVLGKAAADITSILLGKNLPTYTPGVNARQHVVVINTEKIAVTGNKFEEKKYYSHSGYPVGLKEATYKELLQKNQQILYVQQLKGCCQKTHMVDHFKKMYCIIRMISISMKLKIQ